MGGQPRQRGGSLQDSGAIDTAISIGQIKFNKNAIIRTRINGIGVGRRIKDKAS